MLKCKDRTEDPGFTYIVQGLKAFIQDVYLVYTSFLGSLPFKVVWGRSHSITTMDWRCKGAKEPQLSANTDKGRLDGAKTVFFV